LEYGQFKKGWNGPKDAQHPLSQNGRSNSAWKILRKEYGAKKLANFQVKIGFPSLS